MDNLLIVPALSFERSIDDVVASSCDDASLRAKFLSSSSSSFGSEKNNIGSIGEAGTLSGSTLSGDSLLNDELSERSESFDASVKDSSLDLDGDDGSVSARSSIGSMRSREGSIRVGDSGGTDQSKVKEVRSPAEILALEAIRGLILQACNLLRLQVMRDCQNMYYIFIFCTWRRICICIYIYICLCDVDVCA